MIETAEQIPILCAHCGGAASPREDGTIVCTYCTKVDRLPDDQIGRALELRRRVQAAARSVAQLGGMEAALGRAFEDRGALLRAAAPWLLLAVGVLVIAAVQAIPMLANVPPAFVPGLAVQAMIGPLFVASLGFAVIVALLVGRSSWRRRVRPLLLARAPREPGRPSRCRACGADLPDGRGPFLVCTYCRTQSLVTPEIQRDREVLLAREDEIHRARAHAAVAAVSKGSIHMTRTLVVAIVLAYVGMIGLAAVANALLPTG